jgi:hypothetical protein
VTATAQLIATLVAGGMDAAEAAGLVARAAVEMTGALTKKSSAAVRQQRYRDRNEASRRNASESVESVTNRNETVTRYADDEASRTITNRNESVTRDDRPLSSLENKNRKKGERLPEAWSPSDADRDFARALGWSETQIDGEAANFRDYWIAKPGSGGCKLDWPATWRKWIRSSKVKPAGPAAAPAAQHVSGFYAKFGSEEQDAWDAYRRAREGKSFPRDSKGGWNHTSQWPPGYTPNPSAGQAGAPRMRTMQ